MQRSSLIFSKTHVHHLERNNQKNIEKQFTFLFRSVSQRLDWRQFSTHQSTKNCALPEWSISDYLLVYRQFFFSCGLKGLLNAIIEWEKRRFLVSSRNDSSWAQSHAKNEYLRVSLQMQNAQVGTKKFEFFIIAGSDFCKPSLVVAGHWNQARFCATCSCVGVICKQCQVLRFICVTCTVIFYEILFEFLHPIDRIN